MCVVFNYCNSISRKMPDMGARSIMKKVTDKTTPTEFNTLCRKYPQFQIWHSDNRSETRNFTKFKRWTMVHTAAKQGNCELIEYIIKLAPQLLERGTVKGHTPLWVATVYCQSGAVQTLLELGANPNVMISDRASRNTSLLQAAVNRPLGLCLNPAEAARTIKLLLKYGAKQHPDDAQNQNVHSIIAKTSRELAEEREYPRWIFEIIYGIKILPPSDLCELVSEYV